MDIYPLFFLAVFAFGSCAALVKGPIWGLLTYVFVYFNIPAHQWWAHQVPSFRWSLISAGVLVASCFLHKKELSKHAFPKNYPFKWLISFFILMIGILPFSYDYDVSSVKIYDFFRYVIVFFIISLVLRDYSSYKKLILVFIICCFNLSVMAKHYFSGKRLDGVGLPDASDANMLAALVLLVIPLLVALFVTGNILEKWIVFLTTPFIINMFAMCRSRGAFVGLVFQGGLTVFLLRRQIGMKKLLLGGLILSILFIRFMDPAYLVRVVGVSENISEGAMAEASAGRTAIWSYGLNMVKDYPLGAGGGGFYELAPQYFSFEKIGENVRAAHNTYLLVLVDEGFVGLIVYVGFMVSCFQLLRQTRRAERHKVDTHPNGKSLVYHSYAVTISLAGFWAAAFFIDRVYFEGIYLIAALAPALYGAMSRGFEATVQETIPSLNTPAYPSDEIAGLNRGETP